MKYTKSAVKRMAAQDPQAIVSEINSLRGSLALAASLLVQCKTGGCWCGVGLDNPMLKGRHTPKCNQIRLFISQCVEE